MAIRRGFDESGRCHSVHGVDEFYIGRSNSQGQSEVQYRSANLDVKVRFACSALHMDGSLTAEGRRAQKICDNSICMQQFEFNGFLILIFVLILRKKVIEDIFNTFQHKQ